MYTRIHYELKNFSKNCQTKRLFLFNPENNAFHLILPLTLSLCKLVESYIQCVCGFKLVNIE